MEIRDGMIEAAIAACRNWATHGRLVHQSRKFNCIVDFAERKIDVTDNLGTVSVSMFNPEFRKGI